ncbi:uncharacterized protein LOC130709543 [Lotus japonicus]|uniref:uncharacterized protein LOC130709543 n=1 Tax=Lotus japonicus TaxID=34305 RepID=UPI0025842E7D|nr:uncharacterized protein LOC130709543 [Lotus japonicus]
MFLHILAHNLKYRVVHFTYYRSKETISRQFNNVLRAVMKVSGEYLKFQDHNNLEGSEAYKWRWFQNSIGALDGTHIPVTVAAEDKPRYRNRKGDISTNVLGVCGPDLKFIYVLPGWEGSAGDSRVLRDALRRQNHLQIPNDLCAKDRATRIGAETSLDADDIMSKEANEDGAYIVDIDADEQSSTTRKSKQPMEFKKGKSGEKNGIITSMNKVAESLSEFVQATRKGVKNVQEVVHDVMDELKNIPDLNGTQWLKAVD